MNEKNPWGNGSNNSAGNSGASPDGHNPWGTPSQDENPWAVHPETSAFPPANEYSHSAQNAPWDESADFASASYGQGGYYGSQEQPGYEQAAATPQAPAKRKGRWVLPVVIIFALIALVAGAVVVAIQTGWLNLSTQGDAEPHIETEVVVVPAEGDSEESGDDGAADEESEDNDSTDEESDGDGNRDDEAEEEDNSRPSAISLPRSASEIDTSDSRGSARSVTSDDREFSDVYTGTSVTSDAFARAVHSAFLDFYESTGETSGAVSAYSPVTQLNYSMDCRDNGSYITCTGGNNAVVYIS